MAGRSRNLHIPKHCHHKASGRGVVRLNGRDHYTGVWGSSAADTEYKRLVAEWLANHCIPVPPSGAPESTTGGGRMRITVADLILAFSRHVQNYYRRADGTPTGEEVNYRYALRPLRRLYGELAASEFTPLKLKAVRREMITAGLARTVINGRVSRIVRMFRWGVAEELVPETIHRALDAVPNLQKGRSEAREPEPVRPVADNDIVAVLPYLTPQVRAMVELQRMTGLRSSEVCGLRGSDLYTSGDVWEYRPSQHKSLHHRKDRVVFIGPRGREILAPWLRDDPTAFLFSPREAMTAFRATRRESRGSNPTAKREATSGRRPRRQPGPFYTYRSYGYAVRRACDRAGVPRWHPHQIRHTRGTEVRSQFGLEGSQVALGHTNAKITEIYAARDQALARRIAARIG
jgi:integrase